MAQVITATVTYVPITTAPCVKDRHLAARVTVMLEMLRDMWRDAPIDRQSAAHSAALEASNVRFYDVADATQEGNA